HVPTSLPGSLTRARGIPRTMPSVTSYDVRAIENRPRRSGSLIHVALQCVDSLADGLVEVAFVDGRVELVSLDHVADARLELREREMDPRCIELEIEVGQHRAGGR